MKTFSISPPNPARDKNRVRCGWYHRYLPPNKTKMKVRQVNGVQIVEHDHAEHRRKVESVLRDRYTVSATTIEGGHMDLKKTQDIIASIGMAYQNLADAFSDIEYSPTTFELTVSEYKAQAKQWFKAGFNASREGFNGETSMDQHTTDGEDYETADNLFEAAYNDYNS